MKSHQLGRLGAMVAFIATALFAVSMLIPLKTLSLSLSCGVSMFISFGYLCMTCGLAALAGREQKGCAYGALVFAALYAAMVCLVYFTQLATVRLQAAQGDMLAALTYQPGSWMFSIDLFGYAMLSVSTVFAGLAITAETRGDVWLKRLLLIHGVFAVTCFVMPITGVFSGGAGAGAGGSDLFGVIALEFWCLYFLPVAALFSGYMKRQGLKANEVSAA